MKPMLYFCFVIVLIRSASGFFEDLDARETSLSYLENDAAATSEPLMVPLTLIQGADSKGAVCLDGTLPGYHIHRGSGSGANSWLIHLEGGGWCNTIRNCVYRKTTRRGSAKFMEKQLPFTGILSNKAEENPDFFNWNRVKLRYCDGASFSGDSQNEPRHYLSVVRLDDLSSKLEYQMVRLIFHCSNGPRHYLSVVRLDDLSSKLEYQMGAQLYFRGQRIWLTAMQDLMAKGMQNADQALLSGCSAGGLASILHCDEFRDLFPKTTKVKCLSDAGMFLDAVDVSGGHTLRNMFAGVVSLQEVQKNLPITCTSQLDPTSCFFPQNLVANIKTPMFLLNAAYDAWQVQASLAPPTADPHGYWSDCKSDHAHCNSSQIQFFQDFRNQMLNAVEVFSKSNENGLFINSCFAHCQSERQDTWYADDSPRIGDKGIAKSVGDWYFDRAALKAIDCPYPCDKTCRNLVFNNDVISEITISQSTRLTFVLPSLLGACLLDVLHIFECTEGFAFCQ